MCKIIRFGVPENCIEITVPITGVTIAEDQADIYRESSLEWEKGPLSILLKDVTPYAVDPTLWVEILAETDETKPDTGSIRFVRWFVPSDRDSHTKEIQIIEKLEELYRHIESLHHKKENLVYLNRGINLSLEPAIKSIREQVAFIGKKPEDYTLLLDNLLNAISKLYLDDFDLQKEREKYYAELSKIRMELFSLMHNRKILYRDSGILVTIDAPLPGKGILRCGYQVPCAQWRPQHEAHLIEDNKVLFISQAVVWQNTGEPWENVSLTLSTAKPSLGLDVILPEEDILRLREKTKEERKHIKVQVRDQVIQTTGVGESETEEPPLPSDGGETQLYHVPEKVSLPSGGQPFLIKLDEFEMEAETALTALPELHNSVFLISQVKNTGARPILAGPAALHRKDTFIGTGQLEFAGSSEPFHIWWGSEDDLRISRYVDKKEEDASLFQSRKVNYTVTLHVRNLSGEEKGFRIQERVPVSELEQVKVKMKKLPEKTDEPDKNGFLFIPVTLGPREEKKYEISYMMEIDKEVVGNI